MERGVALGNELRANLPADVLEQPVANIYRFHRTVTQAIERVFREELKAPKAAKEEDPFEHFRLTNIRHPEIDALQTAVKKKAMNKAAIATCVELERMAGAPTIKK